MKKIFTKKILPWIFIVLCCAAIIVFISAYHPRIARVMPDESTVPQAQAQDQTIENKNEGYSFRVPASWYAEENTTDTIAIYPNYSPDASSTTASCKIEMSVFPYASSTDVSDWISARLGADPTLDIKELSSEDIAVGNGAGIKWTGSIDDLPTTLVYAFTNTRAYEIAPSMINETSTDTDTDAGRCDDDLDLFLKNLILQ